MAIRRQLCVRIINSKLSCKILQTNQTYVLYYSKFYDICRWLLYLLFAIFAQLDQLLRKICIILYSKNFSMEATHTNDQFLNWATQIMDAYENNPRQVFLEQLTSNKGSRITVIVNLYHVQSSITSLCLRYLLHKHP